MTRMSKHATTLLAGEPVQVLVDKHVIVETVLSRERRITDQTDKRLYTYSTPLNTSLSAIVVRTGHSFCAHQCTVWKM